MELIAWNPIASDDTEMEKMKWFSSVLFQEVDPKLISNVVEKVITKKLTGM